MKVDLSRIEEHRKFYDYYGDPITKRKYTSRNASDISWAVPADNEHSKI